MLRYTEVSCKRARSPFCLVIPTSASRPPPNYSPFQLLHPFPMSAPFFSPSYSVGVPTNASLASLLLLRAPSRAGLAVAPA